MCFSLKKCDVLLTFAPVTAVKTRTTVITACSHAIRDREVAHKRYLSLPSPESHALYISARNHAKNSFIHRKCQNLSRYNSPRDFWHLAKNISNNFTSSSFPFLVQPDGTNAISSISIAELFALTFANNSTLDDSGLVPPCPPPLTTSCYLLKSFVMMPLLA